MYQTEEQIGEKLQFDEASKDRKEVVDGGKYGGESGSDPGSECSE